jgi:hypothetical protein
LNPDICPEGSGPFGPSLTISIPPADSPASAFHATAHDSAFVVERRSARPPGAA